MKADLSVVQEEFELRRTGNEGRPMESALRVMYALNGRMSAFHAPNNVSRRSVAVAALCCLIGTDERFAIASQSAIAGSITEQT